MKESCHDDMATAMTRQQHRVAVLLLEPVVGFDASIAPQLFGETLDASTGEPLYDVMMVSLSGAPVAATPGYSVTPGADASTLATADTVIIPGTRVPGPRFEGALSAELCDALALIRPAARVV